MLALTLAMTTAGLDLLHAAMPEAGTGVETAVVAVTTAVATAVKFLAMKLWVFAPTSLRPAGVGASSSGRGSAQSSTTANDPSASSNTTTPVHS